jgi:hypothetical protein
MVQARSSSKRRPVRGFLGRGLSRRRSWGERFRLATASFNWHLMRSRAQATSPSRRRADRSSRLWTHVGHSSLSGTPTAFRCSCQRPRSERLRGERPDTSVTPVSQAPWKPRLRCHCSVFSVSRNAVSRRGPSTVSAIQKCQPLTVNPHAALPAPDGDS